MRIKSTFKSNSFGMSSIILKYKINEIIKNFSLAGDKFVLKMHLRQLGFTYSAYGN